MAITASPTENADYLEGSTAQTITVNKAALTTTIDDQTKTYGATNPELTVSYNGFSL